MSESESSILFEVHEGVAAITLNRPEQMNTINADARKAYEFGIVSRVVPPDELLATAQEMAQKIAGYAPLAVRSMLELVKRQGNLPEGEAMRLAGTMRWAIGQTADAKEKPRALAEKRTPVFKGE